MRCPQRPSALPKFLPCVLLSGVGYYVVSRPVVSEYVWLDTSILCTGHTNRLQHRMTAYPADATDCEESGYSFEKTDPCEVSVQGED